MAVVAFFAAPVVGNALVAQTAAIAGPGMEDKRNIVNAPMILVHNARGARWREPIVRIVPSKAGHLAARTIVRRLLHHFHRRFPLFVQHRSAIKQEGGPWFNACAGESE